MKRSSASPLAILLLIVGIFFLAIPPVGMIIIVIAFFVNRSYRRTTRRGCHAMRQQAEQRAFGDWVGALKAF